MAKSSIHIQAGKIGFFSHNSRERKTVNAIFNDESNFISCDNKTAIEKFRSELKIRTFKYLQNHPTRKKLHSKTLTHLSAIVNFNKNHTPQDIKKVCDYLEKTLDTKVIQFAMHRDEGHINSKSEAIKNYHAHIEFMGLDSQGNSIRRKLDRKYLINLQSEVANILNMQRGKNYTQLKEPRPKRLDTYPYKWQKEKESKIGKKVYEDIERANKEIVKANENISKSNEDKKKLKADLEVLKKANNQLRAELKDYDLLREDWKKQEDLNRKLQQDLKANRIELDEALEQIEELKKYIFENKELKEKVTELENVIQEKNEELDHYGYRDKLQELKEVKKELRLSYQTIEDLKNEVLNLQKEIDLIYKNNNLNVIQINDEVTQDNHLNIAQIVR